MSELDLMRQVRELERRMRRIEALMVRPYSWGEYIATLANLPYTRAVWGYGDIDRDGNLYDASGKSQTLTNDDDVDFDIYNSIVPYGVYNGTSDFHYRNTESHLNFPGNETPVVAARQGLTVACWFQQAVAGVTAGLVHKGDTTVNTDSNFRLYLNSGVPTFTVYNGAGATSVAAGGAVTADVWHCVVARFSTGVQIDLTLDGVPTTQALAYTSLNLSSKNLYVGAEYTGAGLGNFIDGFIAGVGLWGGYLTDAAIAYMFRYGRGLVPVG